MNVRATAKFVGTSNRKVGLVAALIRGRQAKEAMSILQQTDKRATEPVGKVLGSAIANAENNFNLNSKDLTVEQVLVGPAPTLKRFRPRAQGRASAIRKRMSHITVVLSEQKSKAEPTKASAAAELAKGSDSPRKQEASAGSAKAAMQNDKKEGAK